MLAVVWLSIAVLLHRQYHAAKLSAEANAPTDVHASEDNVRAFIRQTDQKLLLIRRFSAADPAHFDLGAWAGGPHVAEGLTAQFAIIDPAGELLAWTPGAKAADFDISAAKRFQTQPESNGDALFISGPVRGRASGKWAIQLMRKRLNQDQSFAGIVVASIDTTCLSQLFRSLDPGFGELMLIRTDGRVLARAASDPQGADVRSLSLLTRLAQADRGTFRTSDWPDGKLRFVSYQLMHDYPLAVLSVQPEELVYAAWRRARVEYLACGGVLTILVLSVGALTMWHARRLEESQERLLRSQQLLTATLENVNQGIMMTDASRRIAVVNRRAADLLELPPWLMAGEPGLDNVLSWQQARGDPPLEESCGSSTLVYEHVRCNGVVLEVRTERLEDGGAVRTFTDITSRRHAEARLAYITQHDSLTQLANLTQFEARLPEIISKASREGRRFAMLSLDLDRFRLINDIHGHAVADKLLMQVGQRLRENVREGDFVARSGSDEFVIVQMVDHQPQAASALAGRLVEVLGQPFHDSDRSVLIGASIGVAIFPMHGMSADTLLRNADMALYRAKQAGRNTFRFFEAAMDIRVQERRQLELELRHAVASQQFEVHYQPICDGVSREIIGAEALVRWRHPQRGLMPPGLFVQLAEETGLVVPLGRYVLETACAESACWGDNIRLSVNLSPLQCLDTDLPSQITGILERTGMRADRLDLEVTETALINEGERVAETLRTLRAMGLCIAVDDFGTGHASLSYLRRFPFDRIKIDKSFVQSMNDDATSRAIVQAVLALARSLRLDVTAEGVETEAQLNTLRRLQCRKVQGYLLGRPQPAEQFRAMLADHPA
jgi:diguanylate cyclase (GGDEF)-like protein